MAKKKNWNTFSDKSCPIVDFEQLKSKCPNLKLNLFLSEKESVLNEALKEEYGSFVFIVEKHDFPVDSFSLYLFHHPNDSFEKFCYAIEKQYRRDLLIHFGSAACFMAEKESKKKKKKDAKDELDLEPIIKDAIKIGKKFYDSNCYIGKPYEGEERGMHKTPWPTNEDICVEVLYLKGEFYASFYI